MSADRAHLFFDRFVNRVTLRATLCAESGLRVGAGRDDGAVATDLPLLLTADGRPVVPGSSIKGVLRSAAERYLRAMAPSEEDVVRWACDPFGPAPGEGSELTRCWPLKKAKDGPQTGDLSPKARVDQERDGLAAHACYACQTFGANGLASHALFTDAIVTNGARRVRDGVGIHRDLGRAADGIKYDFEVLDPGASLSLCIELHNVADWQVGLLLVVLADIGEGTIRIGGMGSRGLGRLGLVEGPTLARRTLTDVIARKAGTTEQGPALDRYHQAFAALVGGV